VNKPIKKITGILLSFISFVFLVWCFLAHPSTLVVRLLLNLIGFVGFASGLHLAGFNPFGFGKPKEPYEGEVASITKKKKEPEKEQIKEFKKENHDKYMPK
jgi:hypothetical protein